ncbi:phage holin family protein [Gorillibacterium sp. sgz5001074]|uniref:phage holin family protein n=1 Tax=Gorillibacterium sp. sgz5001074 TaxID=3446695 RepID=UPI003F676AFB
MDKHKALWSMAGAVCMPVFDFFYGSGEVVIYSILALIFFLGMDWIAGSRASKKDRSYASKYGIDGIFRTFFMLLLPAGGHFLDMVFRIPSVFFGLLVAGLLYHTIQSATANAIRAGWGQWIPDWLLNALLSWVKSEIESKLSRAQSRLKAKEETNDDKRL